jgi:hypothetical protein
MIFSQWVKLWGQVGGKVMDKIFAQWGKANNLELSPNGTSYSQSYPQHFPRLLQRFIHESTVSTTTTIFIYILVLLVRRGT